MAGGDLHAAGRPALANDDADRGRGRRSTVDHGSAQGGDGVDLFGLLMGARDEGEGSAMADRQLRDEGMTFLFAGHETTGNALAWALHELSLLHKFSLQSIRLRDRGTPWLLPASVCQPY
jgi:cytochrome P450